MNMAAVLTQGHVAVITGAGSGFGLELARHLAQRQMKLVLWDVQPDALAKAEQEFIQQGIEVLAAVVDVSRPDVVAKSAQQALSHFGTPHLVFNNAGVAAGGLIWESNNSDWNWVLGVNLHGVIHGVQQFVPAMLAEAKANPSYRGHVVNTASMAGLLTPPNMGIYNVSKHAVVALSETLYQDLRLMTDQISASVLCPYFVPTGISQSHRNRPNAAPQATLSQRIGQEMSDKAVGSGKVSASDVAALVVEAVDLDRFYIYSHPKALGNVQQRMQAIVEGGQPPDPFASKPEIGESLRAALRGEAAR
ncbi:MAG: putative oxidoreductase SadH [Pseudomonadota bacterium]